MVSIALEAADNAFLQDGQMKDAFESCGDGFICVALGLEEIDCGVLNVTETSVFRDRRWGDFGSEAGQTGESFCGFEAALSELGVREGTQKDGSVGLAACRTTALAPAL